MGILGDPLTSHVTPSRPSWDQAVRAFIERCEGNGLSPATIDSYRWTLTGGRLPAFRKRHDIIGPAELGADALEALKVELLAAGLAPTSVGDCCRVIRVFARFCIDRGWLDSDAILRVKGPRQPKHAPRGFDGDQEKQLLRACKSARDRILVKFIIETGLRREEVVNLTVDDVVRSERGWLIHVRQGKGAKDRRVPMTSTFGGELARYVKTSRPASSCTALFLTSKRSADGEYAALTGDGLYRIWQRLAVATGIRAYPHAARHTFATRLAQDGTSPWAIKEALGHESLAMTEKYVNAAAVDLQDAFANRRLPRGDVAAPTPPPVAPRMDHAAWGRPFPSAEGALPWYVEREVTGDEGTVLVRCFVALTAVLADELELSVGTLPQLLRAAIDDYGRQDGPVGIGPSMKSIYTAVRTALG